jgi:hypothetical protein
MHDIDSAAAATKDCVRCGAPAFYWRSAVMAAPRRGPRWPSRAVAQRQPAWTCMNCGYIEPHDRREPDSVRA